MGSFCRICCALWRGVGFCGAGEGMNAETQRTQRNEGGGAVGLFRSFWDEVTLGNGRCRRVRALARLGCEEIGCVRMGSPYYGGFCARGGPGAQGERERWVLSRELRGGGGDFLVEGGCARSGSAGLGAATHGQRRDVDLGLGAGWAMRRPPENTGAVTRRSAGSLFNNVAATLTVAGAATATGAPAGGASVVPYRWAFAVPPAPRPPSATRPTPPVPAPPPPIALPPSPRPRQRGGLPFDHPTLHTHLRSCE